MPWGGSLLTCIQPLENLEHVFSIISSMEEIGYDDMEGPPPSELYQSLSWVVFETIEKSCALEYTSDSGAPPPNAYKNFHNKIQSIHESKVASLAPEKQSELDFRDSILTLNYDPMIDYAFHYFRTENGGINYSTGADWENGDWNLLKLHGSLNWGIHKDCEEGECNPPVTICEPSPNRRSVIGNPDEVNFDIISNRLKNTECSSCGEENVLDPYIMPPIWSKTPDHRVFQEVWKQAIYEICEARQLVIVGYSMPVTDTFLPYLLSLGLAENEGLHRVIIVNPDDGPKFKERYKKVFSDSMIARNKVHFLTGSSSTSPMTFTKFSTVMDDYVTNFDSL